MVKAETKKLSHKESVEALDRAKTRYNDKEIPMDPEERNLLRWHIRYALSQGALTDNVITLIEHGIDTKMPLSYVN